MPNNCGGHGGSTATATTTASTVPTTTTIATTTNNNYNSTKSINLKSDGKTAATTTSDAEGSGGRAPAPPIAANNHRRDHSSSGKSACVTKDGGCNRETRKYQYGRPQMKAPTPPVSPSVDDGQLLSSPNRAAGILDDDIQLVYCEGNVISGPLTALTRHMVPTATYYPERNYLFAFLLSARLFVRPHELLAEIAQTWERQQTAAQTAQTAGTDVVDEAVPHHHHQQQHYPSPLPVNASASPLTQRKGSTSSVGFVSLIGSGAACGGPARVQRTAVQISAQNCIRLLSDWIETFPYDFRDERLMQQVRILARKCVYIDNALGKQVSRILQLLVQRLTTLERYEEFLQSLTNAEISSYQSTTSATSSSSASSSSSSAGTGTSHMASSAVAANADHQHQHAYHNPLARGASICKDTTTNSSTTNSIVPSSSSDGGTAQSTLTHVLPLPSTTTSTIIGGSGSMGNHSTASGINDSLISGEIPPLDIIDLCPSCAQLAYQLTAIELERLSHIGPEEFVQAFAKEYQSGCSGSGSVASATTTGNVMSNSSTLNDMKKTRNLESYVEWFNRLSYLTASEIVKYPKKKQRVRIIEYWIETARECFNIGNFNSLMAIIAGLNLAPISRLKKTWAKVQSAKFSVLEHQMDPTSNFNSYRSTLKAAMWRSEGATDERERIIIPFFSLFVKDLYFLNESCSNRLPNNHINFKKCLQLAKQVMEFNEWKKVSCPYEKLPNVIAFLQTSLVLNENTLSIASFECETPENTEEKGRYKTVKAETKQELLRQLQEQQAQHHHHHLFHH